jgi:hypothetical protein
MLHLGKQSIAVDFVVDVIFIAIAIVAIDKASHVGE